MNFLKSASGPVVLAMLACGCSLGPDLSNCRIVGARSSHDASGYYVVSVLVENSSPEPVDLSDLAFELTTFDSQNRVLQEGVPFVTRGEIRRYDVDTIPLTTADRGRRVEYAHVFMKDRRGKVISDWPVGEPPVGSVKSAGTSGAPGYR